MYVKAKVLPAAAPLVGAKETSTLSSFVARAAVNLSLNLNDLSREVTQEGVNITDSTVGFANCLRKVIYNC